MSGWTIGILGGSGLYEMDALEEAVDRRRHAWGPPSDELLVGRIEGVKFVFLPRHGRGHRIPPGEVNARANVDALKRAGCTDLLAVSAVGSLREALEPGRFVAVDQFVDRTFARRAASSAPAWSYVSLADPVAARLAALAADAAEAAGAPVTTRHLSGDGGAAILDAGREPSLRPMGLRRDRHDREPRIQARPRGRASLRADRHGHRL